MKRLLSLAVIAVISSIAASGQAPEQIDSVRLNYFFEGRDRAVRYIEEIGQNIARGDSTDMWAIPMNQLATGLGYAGVLGDYKEAVRWFTEAAGFDGMRLNDTGLEAVRIAQYNLGVCHENGMGVEKNDSTAVYFYAKAAANGHLPAMVNLGYAYENGTGIEKNGKRAVEWYTRAADAGNDAAKYNLAYFYRTGTSVRKDNKKYFALVRSAADGGYSEAYRDVGMCYEYGLGTKRDLKEAINWYRTGADSGDGAAMFELGRMYYYGRGVQQDYTEAFRLLCEAERQGNDYALAALGECYRLGRGVERNELKAIDCLTLAAERRVPGGVEKELKKLLKKHSAQ